MGLDVCTVRLVNADGAWPNSRSPVTRRVLIGGAALGALSLLTACARVADEAAAPVAASTGTGAGDAGGLPPRAIEVHSDPGCGCCHAWVDYLRDNGYDVSVSEDPQRSEFRAGLGVPQEAWSCYTGVIAGYAVEGHVPVEAIAKLLADRPDAVGIAAPGMPALSPGMGGTRSDWAELPITIIASDGTLGEFQY